jgi:hypothetical protein
MTSENVVLTEAEFDAFQRFCQGKGFDLCYYGPEIDGREVSAYQSGRHKVIKVKRRRFSSVGIPYDVAEWQQKEWDDALPLLKDEFIKGGIKMAIDKAGELAKADKRRKWVESWVFFRLAATSMAAGILLVLVPSSGAGLPLIGFVMFWFSTACLLAELSRFSERFSHIREWMSLYGDALTPVFILISIASVIFNWAKVVTLLQGGTQASALPICDWTQWFQWFYSTALPWWLALFIVILLVSTIRTLRARVVSVKEHRLKQALKQIGSILVLAAGLFGIYRLQSANLGCKKDIWVILSVVLTVVVFYLLSKDKKSDK